MLVHPSTMLQYQSIIPRCEMNCDRHVLDDTIDKWKVEQRVDGLQSQIRGITALIPLV